MGITNNDYIREYEQLHAETPDYHGRSTFLFIKEICLAIDTLKPKTILDYGCGKGVLADKLQELYPEITIYKYDPAVPDFKELKVEHVDMVINMDVLEHIPEKDIDDVLSHISSLCDYAYFGLHHALAKAILPNGENAHCTVKPPKWYKNKMLSFFPEITHLKNRKSYETVVITRKMDKDFVKKYYKIIKPEMVKDPLNISKTIKAIRRFIIQIKLKKNQKIIRVLGVTILNR